MLTTVLLALLAQAATAGRADDRVHDAITAAVRERMGAGADVTIENLTIDAAIEAPRVTAVPEPGSKLDRAMRFILRGPDPRARSGSATARITVSVAHAHAARNLERGTELSAGDAVGVTHEISTGVLRALPPVEAIPQSRSIRPIAQDACITASAIAMLPAVRGGHEVVAIARLDGVEAKATVMAAENGDAGSVIRVINRQTQRPLKARVITAGVVEIIHD